MEAGGEAPTLRFARAARRLGAAARSFGLMVPAFRCPPRVAGAERTIRRYPSGVLVSVQLRGRPFEKVAADMVEGVIVANSLEGERAQHERARLTAALDQREPHREAA